MDIGCYPIMTSRFIMGEEPRRVLGLIQRDPVMKTDRLSSFVIDYPSAQAIFTVGTQIVSYQRMQFFGTRGRIELQIPFNAPLDQPCNIYIDDGRDLFGGGARTEVIPTCDQYTVQGDEFSRALREGGEVPVPLESAFQHMAIIEAIFKSVDSGKWEAPERL
jgi:predicted dehydrogenase